MSRALAVALTAAVVLAGTAAAQADPGAHDRFTGARDKTHPPSARAAAHLRARALKASGTLLHECDDPPGTLCGSIDVPLDRAHPGLGTMPIFFAVIPHGDPGPAAGTILGSSGGPGFSTTADGIFGFLFGPLLDKRDVLMIDLRGTGRSGAIDCEAAQHGIGEERDAVRACGAQLGAAASRATARPTGRRTSTTCARRSGSPSSTTTASPPAGSRCGRTRRGTATGCAR
jgi:hypothetical protein